MDRLITYVGSIPLDTDILNTNKAAMIGTAAVIGALFDNPLKFKGLSLAPSVPAGMSVQVLPGMLFAQVAADATPYGSLPADSTSIFKSALLKQAVSVPITAPTVAGQSVIYLVEAQFVEADTAPAVLTYYNASNPTQSFSGPADGGQPQPTLRSTSVNLLLKSGTPATTGTQTAPTVDGGCVPLGYVTSTYGDTAIDATHITPIPSVLLAPYTFPSLDTLTQQIATLSVGPGGSLLTGSGAPAAGLGTAGSVYIDLAASNLYSKSGSGWSAPTSLIGQAASSQGALSVKAFLRTTDTSFTVPAGCTSLRVTMWGAGAGGGAFTQGSAPYIAGVGGGGSGGYSSFDIGVTPGEVIPCSVGAGGAIGMPGGATTFGPSTEAAVHTVGGGLSPTSGIATAVAGSQTGTPAEIGGKGGAGVGINTANAISIDGNPGGDGTLLGQGLGFTCTVNGVLTAIQIPTCGNGGSAPFGGSGGTPSGIEDISSGYQIAGTTPGKGGYPGGGGAGFFGASVPNYPHSAGADGLIMLEYYAGPQVLHPVII